MDRSNSYNWTFQSPEQIDYYCARQPADDGPGFRGGLTKGCSTIRPWVLTALYHRPMPPDAGLQHLVHRLLPPGIGENLDLGIAGKPLRLDRRSYRFDIDHAVAHHAAVVENVPGRHQPIADVKRQQALFARAGNLRQ